MQNTQFIKKKFLLQIKFLLENDKQKYTFFAICLGRKT